MGSDAGQEGLQGTGTRLHICSVRLVKHGGSSGSLQVPEVGAAGVLPALPTVRPRCGIQGELASAFATTPAAPLLLPCCPIRFSLGRYAQMRSGDHTCIPESSRPVCDGTQTVTVTNLRNCVGPQRRLISIFFQRRSQLKVSVFWKMKRLRGHRVARSPPMALRMLRRRRDFLTCYKVQMK